MAICIGGMGGRLAPRRLVWRIPDYSQPPATPHVQANAVARPRATRPRSTSQRTAWWRGQQVGPCPRGAGPGRRPLSGDPRHGPQEHDPQHPWKRTLWVPWGQSLLSAPAGPLTAHLSPNLCPLVPRPGQPRPLQPVDPRGGRPTLSQPQDPLGLPARNHPSASCPIPALHPQWATEGPAGPTPRPGAVWSHHPRS